MAFTPRLRATIILTIKAAPYTGLLDADGLPMQDDAGQILEDNGPPVMQDESHNSIQDESLNPMETI